MRLLRLKVENTLRVVAVDIDASGTLTVIGGDNEQGKSSVIHALAMALGGRDRIPDDVIHHGAKKSYTCVETDKLTVELTVDQGGPKLVVRSKETGKRVTEAPQTLLDSLLGPFTFDPLAFVHMKKQERLETAKRLAGLDFDSLDKRRAALYMNRTGENAAVVALQSRIRAIAVPDGTPETEVDVVALTGQLEAGVEYNRQKEALERAATVAVEAARAAQAACQRQVQAVEAAEQTVKDLETKLEAAKLALSDSKGLLDTRKTMVENAELVVLNAAKRRDEFVAKDLSPLRTKIAEAGTVNRNVNLLRSRAKLQEELKLAQEKAASLTAQIDEIDEQKRKAVADAALPVPGMSFSDDDVLVDGCLFDNLSDAAKLITSVRMGVALMPKDGLRLMLIENGEKLDARHRQMVVDELKAAGAQCLMEVVSQDASVCSVIIEDGRVRGAQ